MRPLLVSILLLTFARMAFADDSAKHAEAKIHYEAGDRAFRLGDFDRAIKEFKASYDLSGVPLLLYNVAQSYRQKGDTKQALFFYQQFIAAGASGDAKRIAEQRVDELKVVLDQQEKAQHAPPTGMGLPTATPQASIPAPPTPSTVSEPPPARNLVVPISPQESARRLKLSGIVIAAFGAASIVAGGAFYAVAKSANDSLNHPQNGTYSHSSEQNRDTFQKLDIAAFAVGGVALATGAVLYGLGYRNGRRVSIGADAGHGHASALLTSHF
jgi:tetratricopeptide (TPR) repeat protein